MHRPQSSWTQVSAVALVVLACSPLAAQEAAPAAARRPYRVLAPGVIQSVDPQRELAESFSRHDLVELLAVDAKFDWAKDRPFRHDVWTLDFRFKPMRMIWIDVPQAGGNMQRKLIWYMVYSVTNHKVPEKIFDGAGPEPPPQFGWLRPVEAANGTYQVQSGSGPIRFIPEFLLESKEFGTVYRDTVIPVAVGPIRLREDRNRRFYTTVEMCDAGSTGGKIAPGETLWGVVTWQDIDPRIDRFSVYVQGLTNAYHWRDEPGAYKKDDRIGTGRRISRKTLKLNYWRPGDEYYEHEREIRYGGIPEEVDYEWVYR
ncbi:MAG: hypothetical protein JXB62_16850 [Pirellulales bacterium]|nr:hypothetical protein [Pirellulales bacterium]